MRGATMTVIRPVNPAELDHSKLMLPCDNHRNKWKRVCTQIKGNASPSMHVMIVSLLDYAKVH